MKFKAAIVVGMMLLAFVPLLTAISLNPPQEMPQRSSILWTPEAGTSVWDAPANGVASLDTNWNPVGVPGAGQNIIFNATSTYDCDWDLAINCGDFSILAGDVNPSVSFGVKNIIISVFGGLSSSDTYTLTVNGTFTKNHYASGHRLIFIGEGGGLVNTTIVKSHLNRLL